MSVSSVAHSSATPIAHKPAVTTQAKAPEPKKDAAPAADKHLVNVKA